MDSHLQVVERPQHMLMRVALGIHLRDIDSAIETYHLMAERWFTHASPTMFNAGTPRPQMSSCFLLSMVCSIHSAAAPSLSSAPASDCARCAGRRAILSRAFMAL